jgi:hypothetical protein
MSEIGLNRDVHFFVRQMTAIGDLRFLVGAPPPMRYLYERA